MYLTSIGRILRQVFYTKDLSKNLLLCWLFPWAHTWVRPYKSFNASLPRTCHPEACFLCPKDLSIDEKMLQRNKTRFTSGMTLLDSEGLRNGAELVGAHPCVRPRIFT